MVNHLDHMVSLFSESLGREHALSNLFAFEWVFLAGVHFEIALPTFPSKVIYVTSLTSHSPNITETQKDGLT